MKFLIDSKHGLGDCVQIIPMLQIIKENYPDSYLAVIVNNKASKELLQLSPVTIDKFYYLDMSKMTTRKFLGLILDLHHQGFDYFILSPITTKWKAKCFAMLTGAERCIGEQYRKLSFCVLEHGRHMVERNLNLLSEICRLPQCELKPRLQLETTDNSLDINTKANKIIGVCIGGGTALFINNKRVYPKKWSINKFKTIIEALLKKSCAVVLLGGKDEIDELQYLKEILEDPNIYNYVGKTSITESAKIAQQCDLLVGVDTGMQHIAAAVGTRTLSIFGPTDPKVFGPYSNQASFIEFVCDCKYCYGTDMYLLCKERKCLQSITSDMVLSKVFELLSGVK